MNKKTNMPISDTRDSRDLRDPIKLGEKLLLMAGAAYSGPNKKLSEIYDSANGDLNVARYKDTE